MMLMVQALKAKVGSPLRKLVLVKLADQANDDGECWPSYQSIAEACEMSRRTVISHIEWLEENGFLRRNYRKSKEGLSRSNVFVLTIESGANTAPQGANNSPRGANAAPPSGENFAPGGANAAPIETVNESISFESVNESGGAPARDPATREPSSEIPKPPPAKPERFDPMLALGEHGVDEQLAADWLTVRRQKRAPLTQTALDGLVREAMTAGIPVVEAVRICVERGWVGFKASWGWRDDAPQHPQGRVFDQQGREVVQPAGVPSGFGAATMPPQRTSKVAQGISLLEELKDEIRRGAV